MARTVRQARSGDLERATDDRNQRGFFAADSLQKQQTGSGRFNEWLYPVEKGGGTGARLFLGLIRITIALAAKIFGVPLRRCHPPAILGHRARKGDRGGRLWGASTTRR